MDEDQYRSLYQTLNPQRCVFEKALNNRRCDCAIKERFLLATREGVRCQSNMHLEQCTQFLAKLRQNARFALKEISIDGPLPHNKELKVQAGGSLALQQLLMPDLVAEITVSNMQQLLEQALTQYGSIDELPYPILIRGILQYQSRPKRRGG